MKTLLAKGCWNIAKGKLKQKLARLTEDEIQFTKGKEEELRGRIQKRTAQGIEGPTLGLDPVCACHRLPR